MKKYYPRLSRLVEMTDDPEVLRAMVRLAYEKYGGIHNDININQRLIESVVLEEKKKKKKRKARKRRPIFGYGGWVGYFPYDMDNDGDGDFGDVGDFGGDGGDGGE